MHIIKIIYLSVCLTGLSVHANAHSFPTDTSYTTYQTWLKLRKNYPQIKIAATLSTDKLLQYNDVVYKTTTDSGYRRDLHLDIVRPASQKTLPALIMIHGGGWRSGNKSMEMPMAQRIALQGYVTIPVEYRLSLEAKYPAAVHDIKAAIRWVKDNAGKYGIDTTRIAIEGESAGGQLAMLVAMTNNVPGFEGEKGGSKSGSTVHAAIDVDGVVDFLAPNSLNIERKPNSADVSWLGGTFLEKPAIWKEASPAFWVSKNSVPVLFVCSSVPRFHAGRDEMIDMLNQHGIYSESVSLAGTPHSFWLFEPWMEPTVNYMLNFLNKVFQKK